MNDRPIDIFVSYRRGDVDSAVASHIQDHLAGLGYSVYFDRDERANPTSLDYQATMRSALEQSAIVVALIGPAWLAQMSRLDAADDWVRQELLAGHCTTKRLVPIYYGAGIAPESLRSLQGELSFLQNIQSHLRWCGFQESEKLQLTRVLNDHALSSEIMSQRSAATVLAAVADLPLPLVRQAFFNALGHVVLAQSHHRAAAAGARDMVLLLSESVAEHDQPSPLARFALDLSQNIGDPARLAALIAWLHRHVDQVAWARYKATFRADRIDQRDATCFLLVTESENDANAAAVDLNGYLFGGVPFRSLLLTDAATPLTVFPDGTGRPAALAELLDRAARMGEAEFGIETPQLVVEFALPMERIDDDVESYLFGATPEPRRHKAIGHKYPVVRRLLERVVALGSTRNSGAAVLQQWQKTARRLGERFDRHGLRIVWAAPGDIPAGQLDRLLSQHPESSCVGLPRAAAGAALDIATKESLLDDAVPFACWSADAWSAVDMATLERDMAACAGVRSFGQWFQLCADRGFSGHPVTGLRLLWDDPAHNPHTHRCKGQDSG